MKAVKPYPNSHKKAFEVPAVYIDFVRASIANGGSSDYERRRVAENLAIQTARRLDPSRLIKFVGILAYEEGTGRIPAELINLVDCRRLFGDHDDFMPLLGVPMGPLND